MDAAKAQEEVPDEHKSQYAANFNAHRPGISTDQMIDAYNQWAQGTYEQDVNEEHYKGPIIVAEAIEKWIENKDARILDVAAGTGFVAEQLQGRGFTNIDALEPAEEMLNIARKKNIYKNCFLEIISGEPCSISENSYDVIVIAGAMGEGHIPCAGLNELIRITKPGGHVIFVIRKEYLSYVPEYKDRLVPLMKRLEAEGQWTCLQDQIIPFYSFNKPGISYVFKVLKSS